MVDLGEGEATIGRSRGCTVTLRDPSASRNHLLLIVKPGEVWARDLQSSNGTYLNGERLTSERQLNDGDRLTIGETDLFMRIAAPAAAAQEVGATVRIDGATMQCPACGAELPLHGEFCPRCGHRMGADAAAAAAGAYEPPAFESPPPPPPASAPAMPPAYAAAPPLLAPSPPPPPPESPPAGGGSETRQEASARPLAASSASAHDAPSAEDGELLPPIADDVFHAASRPPVKPAAPPRGEHRAALPATPPPLALGEVPLPRPPGPADTAPAPTAAAAAGGATAAAAATGLRPAGFWIRWFAQLIDGIWILALVVVPALFLGGLRNPNAPAIASLLWVLVNLFLVVPCWAFFGATPGKAVLGLRIVGGKRRRGLGLVGAFLRLCAWMVSAATFGLGFLMVAFTRDKRGLHDHLAGTAVVRR